MIPRIIGVGAGVAILLLVLFLRGLPVLFFLKMLPLALLLILASVLIYAGVSSD